MIFFTRLELSNHDIVIEKLIITQKIHYNYIHVCICSTFNFGLNQIFNFSFIDKLNSSNNWQNYDKYQTGSKIKWQQIHLHKSIQFRQHM
jgi:hypothetical protein